VADLPAPVAPDLLSPVRSPAELPSPVAAGLPTPVRPDLMQPLRPSPIPGQGDAARSAPARVPHEDEELNLDGLDIPPPPMNSVGSPPRPAAAPAPPPALGLGDLGLGGLEDLALPEPGPRPAPAPPAPVPLAPILNAPSLESGGDLEPPTRPLLTGPRSDAPEAEPAEPGLSRDLISQVAETQAQRQAAAAAAPQAEEKPKKPKKKEMTRRRKILIFGGAALGALLLIGGGLTAFLLLQSGRTPEAQAQINEAQKLLLEDMLPSYRKAAEKLAAVAAQDEQDIEALALEAQARLSAARHGVAAESQKADALLRRIPQERQGELEPAKARALKDLIAGKAKEAARALTPLAKGAAARKDPFPALYQGWAELRAGDYAAAERAFRASLSIRPKTPAALLGVAQAKEKAGDRKGAYIAYSEALGVAPTHFSAAMGKIRTGDDPAGEAQLLDLVAKRQANAAPRELADAWAILGARAIDLSRRKDAEDRLRRAMAADPTNVPARVALARLLCDDNKVEEATELARRTYKDDPKNPEAGLVLVRALLMGKKPLDAGPPLEALVKMAPKDPRVLYWQGRREEEVAAQGSDARAAALYRQAIEINPRYLDAYIALSRVLGRQGETTEALASLRQVASQVQGDALLATSVAEAYLGMGEAARAEEAFRMALEKKPDMHHARLSLAQALESQGKLGEAVAELEELQKRSNGYPGLNERRAQLLIKQERFSDAEAAYLAAAAEAGASVELRLDAAAFTLKGHAQEAKAILEGVIKEAPRNQRAYALMAQLLLLQGLVPEAAVRAETAAKLGDSPEVHLARGMVLLQQNKRADAEQALALARKGSSEGRAMLLHARLLADDGRAEDAQRELQDLIGRSKALLADRMVYRPEDVREILGNAYLQLADLEVLLGHPEKSLPAYEQATRLLPKSGEAAARYGKVLYQLEKRRPAIVQFNRAVQLGGDSAPYALDIYLTLGDCLRESRQRAEAIRAYQKWLSLAPALAPERKEVEQHVQNLAEGRRH
jgi:tetratricopeptide (TPR) repeat protein